MPSTSASRSSEVQPSRRVCPPPEQAARASVRGVLGPSLGMGPRENWLRRLMFLGVCLPVAFIVVIQLVRPSLLQRWQFETVDIATAVFAGAATVCFGIVMVTVIGNAYKQVMRRNAELAAVNELLLAVAGEPDGDTAQLAPEAAAAEKALGLLGGIDAGLWRVDVDEDPRLSHPLVMFSPVRGPEAQMLWVARDPDDTPFDCADQRSLDTLAELTGIAQERDRGRAAARTNEIVGERLRISREMHDSLAQIIAVSHLKLRALAAHPDLPEGASGELTDLADACESAYTDIRESIHGLRESSRPDRDVIESMRAYVAWFARQSGVEATFRVEGCPALGPYEAAHVLRVMQEALANVRKHARASAVQVVLESVSAAESALGHHTVRLLVVDDGRGFDVEAAAPEAHYGLKSMRERAVAVSGRLAVRRRSSGGIVVEMEVPAAPDTAADAGEHVAVEAPGVVPRTPAASYAATSAALTGATRANSSVASRPGASDDRPVEAPTPIRKVNV